MTREELIESLILLKEQARNSGANTFVWDIKIDSFNFVIDSAIEALEQELCEDEYIKVPKKALKYRTAGMVAYNAEWLKNHFDIERAVICGAQEPKTGQWIKTPKAVMGEGYMWYCDKCEYEVYQDSSRSYPSEKYCPNCGAKMVDLQESEDKHGKY